MARIRSIKPEFCVSEQLAECSPNARLVFALMWMFCDDQGIHPAKPKTLKAEIFPMDDFTGEQVAEWVGELIKVRLLREYTIGSETYWIVTGWSKHQKIDKPSKKHPPPLAEDSPSPRRTLAEPSPPESSRVERSRGEGNTQPPEQALSGGVSRVPAPPPPPRAAAPSSPEFPKADDARVLALHGIACAARCRLSILDAQQWVAEGLTEAQILEATARAKAKKPGETIPLKFLQCFVNDVKAGVGSAAGYDAEAVKQATIAAINAREGHATH